MMSIHNPSNKIRKQIEEQIFYNLMQIVEQYPQYTPSQHFIHFLRTKGDTDPYFWTVEKLLKKIENYRDELDNELVSNGEED